ncbi:S8 family serine peptidase [Streptomyces sp. NPDC058001]|uniref:S8 family serine peptidase n=1 Tax=Streptomyces sp. NPDC058001 TaxID=3346300 RepID=UPI0036E70FF5
MRRIRCAAVISVGLALTVGGVAPVAARTTVQDTGVTATPTSPPGKGKDTATVRLVTGDRVTVTKDADGKRVASVEPGSGRRGVLFRTMEQDGDLSVLPSDALDLVSTGRLDRQLFNVTALIEQGYDEAHGDTLPLIIGQSDGASASAVNRLTALTDDDAPARRLDSIDAQAVRVPSGDLGRFWKQLVPSTKPLDIARTAVTPKIWLDGRVDAALDRSTGQINAPALWKAGYDGKAVKVAVLDTGADQSHPDLAHRIGKAKDFSGSSGTNDAFGHGTHVAATVGGSGAASGGSRKGVAPAADLLIGKVLGDDGYGSESQVIDGMEWAAAEGAKVVNMSLGADIRTDGTDPMSLALNELTRSSGALFVVAAGNNGEQGPGTVGSPGAADAALTVGAVDRDDTLAPFSSRGPRDGDRAVKPDVTAPGVGIVAARAAGTTMGDPVDPYYVAASGTSMATPHVAGAAALVAQAHPTWDAQRIKDALISSARTVEGQQPTEQGGGRIDVAAAALGRVTATGTVALGPFQTGDDSGGAGRTATVRYTNTSDQEISLALTARLATTGGRNLPDGALRLGSASVRIAAGATVDVPLTADPSRAGRGDYYGYVTAVSADSAVKVHTTVSLVVHGPVHRLTVTTLDHKGKRVDALPIIWGPDGFVQYTGTSPAVAEVEEGTYQVDYSSIDDADDGQELRHVVLPEVKVTKDTDVTLDARKTTLVDIRTPKPAEQRGIINYQTYRRIDGHGLTEGTMYFDVAKRLYVSPTAKVTDGTFEFASRWQLVAQMIEAKVSGTDLDLNPYYTGYSPMFDERGVTLTAVDAGGGAKPDFRGVRGKLAVVREEDGVVEDELARKAAAAGAKGLLLIHFGDIAWTRWRPDGDRTALPLVRTGTKAGDALLDRLRKRPTTVRFTGTARSPYLYDVMQVSEQRIPERVVHTVSAKNSAVVRSTYADNGGLPWAAEQRFGRRPYQEAAWLQYTRFVPTGFARTEYISANGTEWQHRVHHRTTFDIDWPLVVGMNDAPRTYRPGERLDETWQGAVIRPSIPKDTATPSVRNGDVLALRIPEFTDSTPGHRSRYLGDDGDTAAAVLYRDGVKAGESEGAWADFEVRPGTADYRLDVTTSRQPDEWAFGPRTDTSWSFRSGTTDKAAPLPLLQLDYDVPVGADNAVRAGRSHTIGLSVRAQNGLPAPRGVSVRVEASYDDGKHWSGAVVKDRGSRGFTATVARPSGHGDRYVTLRVTARDGLGNSVRQTVERAYLHRG